MSIDHNYYSLSLKLFSHPYFDKHSYHKNIHAYNPKIYNRNSYAYSTIY